MNDEYKEYTDEFIEQSETDIENNVPYTEPVIVVDSSAVAQAVVAALDEREQARLMADGEIMVPGTEEITVISDVVQRILSYFQENDNQILSDIRRDVSDIKEYLESQEQPENHLMMTTNFTDYTVTEGLLLLILLWLIMRFCVRMLKGGFSWLMS